MIELKVKAWADRVTVREKHEILALWIKDVEKDCHYNFTIFGRQFILQLLEDPNESKGKILENDQVVAEFVIPKKGQKEMQYTFQI
jgi:hypothetical protein